MVIMNVNFCIIKHNVLYGIIYGLTVPALQDNNRTKILSYHYDAKCTEVLQPEWCGTSTSLNLLQQHVV